MKKEDRGRIIEALNQGVGREIAAIVQYSNQHSMAEGMASPEISELFEETAKDEMRHMEMFSERIVYLGGTPTTKPWPIKTGKDLKKMLEDDLEIEYNACELYKKHVKLVAELGDTTTRLMLEKILTNEEEHIDRWETILAKRKIG